MAGSPKEALEISKRQTLNLLLTDVIMPDINGPELYQRLLKTHPGLKVLYMSGYTNNVIAHHGILDDGINIILKPFSQQDLIKKINFVMAQGGEHNGDGTFH
jgi:YesN/AraC family two-component response regulator